MIMKDIFKIKKRNSSIAKEIIGGVVVFFSMVYVIPLTANLLSLANMNYQGVFIATAIASSISSILMGLIANFPAMMSAGMGFNTFFTFTICNGLGFSYQEALAICLVAGIIFFVITIFDVREKLFNAIPKDIKTAIIVGLGAFIAFVGIKNSGLVIVENDQLSLGSLSSPSTLLALFGVILMLVLLNVRGKIKTFAVPIAIATTAIVGVSLGAIFPELQDQMPTISKEAIDIANIKEVFGKSFFGFGVLKDPKAYMIIFSIVFVHIFDSSPTLYALNREISKEPESFENEKKVLICDANGCVISSVLGTSPVTCFVESTVATKIGARTGLSAIVSGILFFLTIFAYQGLSVISHPAVTSMALIGVGAMIFGELKNINWEDKITVTTTFLIIIFMIVTYSIVDGIGLGIIFYSIMMLASKRGKEVNKLVYVIASLFVVSYILNIIIGI